MLGPSSPNFQTRPSAVLSAVARIYGEGSTDRQKEKKRGEEEKDGSRKRGRVSRQRIISMTSKGVVISRPFLPFLSARVFLHAGTGLRVAAASHPCVIVLIQPYPSSPSNHLLLGFSTPPPGSLFAPAGGGRKPSSVIRPPPPSTLLKHDFRRQTKRASVVYNEAPLLRFLAVVPGVVTFLLLLLFVHEEYGQIQSRRRFSVVISVYLFGVDPWKFFFLSIFGKVRVSSTNCGLWIHRINWNQCVF